MALPAVGNTNFGLRYAGASVGEACDVQQTTNISLKNLCIGAGGLTFGTGDGDACNNFDLLGGSNNSISGFTSNTDITSAATLAIGQAPYKMSELIGGTHVPGGGPGQ
jgi:hypothetical protein